jgi:hypothetical protein
MKDGSIRWACADVPGVTGADLGQEYCEYHAVQGGTVVAKGSDIASGKPLQCVFTGVFDGAGLESQLRAAMAVPANLGAAVTADSIVQMQHDVNGSDDATGLLSDCTNAGNDASSATQRLRATACYQAFAAKPAGDADAARLQTLCKVSGSISDASWTTVEALGAKILAATDSGFDAQRDLANCLSVRNAGEPWRNSDAMICGRISRAANECGCRYNDVPDSVHGFSFVGWVNDRLPDACRYAKVDGHDEPSLVICDATAAEIADIPLNADWNRDVASFCNTRFASQLVMKAPVRALQKAGSCADHVGFCHAYLGNDP